MVVQYREGEYCDVGTALIFNVLNVALHQVLGES